MFVDIDDLRMRINLQQRECFPLAAVGINGLFIECLTHHSARAIRLTASRIVQVDGLCKTSKFQLNRMKNITVIRGQNFRHSIPTLDCLSELNPTFTDQDETGARQKVWANCPKIIIALFSSYFP